MSCVNERTQATEPCDGAQAMLEGSQLDKMEDGWVTLALSYKGKVMQEYECILLCNLMKQLDESMAIVQVSKHLHHSPGMPDSGKFEGPSNMDKFLKVLILRKTPNQELMKVDFSTVEKKLLTFDPGGLEAGNSRDVQINEPVHFAVMRRMGQVGLVYFSSTLRTRSILRGKI